MPSYQHKTLLNQIQELALKPSDVNAYERWISANDQIVLLDSNSVSDELIVYACGPYFFVYTVTVGKDALFHIDQEHLLDWAVYPDQARASYESNFNDSKIQIYSDSSPVNAISSGQTKELIFMRHFDGTKGEPSYCEVLQEYAHLSGIHWRIERSSFCRFDENGDYDDVVSFTSGEGEDANDITLVSFKREPLDLYLAASDSLLIRMFDFTLFQPGKFTRWPDRPESLRVENDKLLYRQRIDPGKAGYARGVQLIYPIRSDAEIFSIQRARLWGENVGPWVEFEIYDIRNDCITTVSTDPSTTTNYFMAEENSLPYEISPAFFNAEVLAKYKADREKYVVDEVGRSISCRNAWELRRFDVNEAGQIHAYICYLRDLPPKEQEYWRNFNETPITGISRRAFQHDIMGQWTSVPDPLLDLLSVLRQWHHKQVNWWNLRNTYLLDQITTPHTTSRDEWSQAFMDLSQVVIEGLDYKAIRNKLDSESIDFKREEKSIALLEKLLVAKSLLPNHKKLEGLRMTNTIRNKVRAHSGSTQAKALVDDALRSHETFAGHFRHVCSAISKELQLIEQALDSPQPNN